MLFAWTAKLALSPGSGEDSELTSQDYLLITTVPGGAALPSVSSQVPENCPSDGIALPLPQRRGLLSACGD